jgi:hypothetical protein
MLDNLIVIKFNAIELPCFKEVSSKPWIMFGDKDDYPDTLLSWYNNSAKHNAIINGKVTYIFGNGLVSDDINAQMWMQKVNSSYETLNDIIRKVLHDEELYGGFYMQVIPTGISYELYHVPYHKVRSSADNSMFYYKADGDFNSKKDQVKPFPSFKIGTRETSIYFFKSYRPGIGVYPTPSYIGAANYICADIEVGKHTFNNASAGFTASKFINFYNGEPTDEIKGDVERRFKKKFTGSAADKMIIGFNADPTKKPTIDDLGSSDLTKEDFSQVDNLIQQNIYAGHQITSPMLFGIKTEGQLGGNTELQVSYEIFKNTYANYKQQELERVVKIFASLNGIQAPITFNPLSPVLSVAVPGTTPQGTVTAEQMTNDAVRNLSGRGHQQLLRIIRQHSKGQLTAQAAGTLLKTSLGLGDDEINSLLGIDGDFSKDYSEEEVAGMFESIGQGREEFLVIKSKPVQFSSDKECLEDELHTTQEFYVATTLDSKILSLIQKDKRITPEVIAKALKITPEAAAAKIQSLTDEGFLKPIQTTVGTDTIIERELTQPLSDIKPPEISLPDISIKYSYEWNPIVPSGQRDSNAHPSRPFCKKLMELDKFYSRTEIESISERLGYSVWDRRGGFWNKGGEISPTCRHIWRSQVVIKKKK